MPRGERPVSGNQHARSGLAQEPALLPLSSSAIAYVNERLETEASHIPQGPTPLPEATYPRLAAPPS